MEPDKAEAVDRTVQRLALIGVGVWMFAVNRKLNRQNLAMRELVQGMLDTNYNIGLLHTQATTVNEIVKLAAAGQN